MIAPSCLDVGRCGSDVMIMYGVALTAALVTIVAVLLT
jgi:hypothetical protein